MDNILRKIYDELIVFDRIYIVIHCTIGKQDSKDIIF